ncbi:MAG: cell envelope integrity protein TolA [Burkholderiaceae bacterium]
MSREQSAAERFPNRPRPSRSGRLKALGLALLIHLGLVAMLFVGVSWRSSEPPPVIAELWTPAPALEPVEPTPEPTPEPVPPPEPPPPPPPPQPEPPPPEPAPDPQIAIEKAKREEEERRKAEAERQRQLAEEKRKAEEERQQQLAEEKKRQAEEERQRRLAEEKRKAEEERQRKLAEEKKRKAEEERQRKLAEEKKRQAAERARRERAEADRQRAEYLERLQQAAAGSETGASQGAASGGASGARASSGGTGMDAGYRAKLSSAIRTNTSFLVPSDLRGNPKAEFAVRLREDCSIASITLRKSSGHPGWDAAAERGIQRTDPFPRTADGTCPTSFVIERGPRDD